MADDDKTKPRVRSRRRPPQTGGRPAAVASGNTENTHADPDYEVGYGKPPKATQFKKGQSGNPKGRPKGRKNFATELAEELAEFVKVSEGGKQRTISKQRAVIKSTVNAAARGSQPAVSRLLKMLADFQKEEEEGNQEELLSEDQQELLDAYLTRRFVSKLGEHDGGKDV